MVKRCSITKKNPMSGNNVSHAVNKTKRRFYPNLHNVSFFSDVLGKKIKLKVSSRGIKTVEKIGGIDNYVVKKNLKSNALGYFLLKNEILALKKLQPYKHFPKLLAYDTRRMSIFMTFCGQQITSKNIPDDWEEQINEIEQILKIVNENFKDKEFNEIDELIYEFNNGGIKISNWIELKNFTNKIISSYSG